MSRQNRLAVLALVGAATLCGNASAAPFSPIPTPFTKLTAPADPDRFTFVVGGDNRSTGHGTPMPPSLDAICREIGIVHPAFTFWTGDCIEGYDDTVAEANAEYDVFLASAAKTGVPMFNAPGNHEFALDMSLLPVYKKRMGDLYGSFDYGHSHFVAVNTNAVEPDGTIRTGNLDGAQWAWLEQDLKDHESAKNIFVFMHHYPFGPVEDDPKLDSGMESTAVRDKFHALMMKYNVRAVFAGHNHRYWHTVKDGIDYYISGGAGAPLDALPTDGGYLHYVVVHVNDAKQTVDILQPWHLTVTYPDGDRKALTTERAEVSNTEGVDVSGAQIMLRMAAPHGGQTYAATAGVAYKKKSKSEPAKVMSVTPVGHGLVDVAVGCDLIKSRTTEVTVAPVASAPSLP